MNPDLSRRTVLSYGLAGATIAGAGLLSSCSSQGDSPGGDEGTSGAEGSDLPKHVPFEGTTPDVKGENGAADFYRNYPQDPAVTVSDTPGDGEPISAMLSIYYPAWGDAPENTALDELNNELGSALKFQQVPGAEYTSKFQTMVAGNDLPTMMEVRNVARLPELLKSKFIDLSEHLSGEAVTAYPNLANLPETAWQAARYNGGIYGIPATRGMWQSAIMHHRDDLLAERGMDVEQITNFDDFLAFCIEVTDAKTFALTTMPTTYIRQMLRIPNNWQLDNGNLIHAYEVPEQEEALNALRKLAEAKVIRPDWSTLSSDQVRELFTDGSTLMTSGTYQGWTRWHRSHTGNWPFDFGGMPIPGFDGGEGVAHLAAPTWAIGAISKGNEERVETLLRVWNYLAAPFGSKEQLTVLYGREGADYELDGSDPVQTEQGKKNAMLLTTIVCAPQMAYYPNDPAVAEKLQAHMQRMAPIAIDDPVRYVYSDTKAAKEVTLSREADDVFTDIVLGRREISEWAAAVENWRKKGGDQMRGELEEAVAAEADG